MQFLCSVAHKNLKISSLKEQKRLFSSKSLSLRVLQTDEIEVLLGGVRLHSNFTGKIICSRSKFLFSVESLPQREVRALLLFGNEFYALLVYQYSLQNSFRALSFSTVSLSSIFGCCLMYLMNKLMELDTKNNAYVGLAGLMFLILAAVTRNFQTLPAVLHFASKIDFSDS